MRSLPLLLLAALVSIAPAIAPADIPTNAPPPLAPTLLIHRVDYDAKLTEHEARVTGRYDVELIGKGDVTVPLFEGALAVPPGQELPKDLRLARDGSRYTLTLSKARRYRFSLEFVCKVEHAEGWYQTLWSGPQRAVIAAITAQTSGTDVDLELRTELGTVTDSGVREGATVLHGLLGDERIVSLRWRNKAAEVTRQTLLTCETAAMAHITPTVIKCRTELSYTVVQGVVSNLEVNLPVGQTLTRLQGAQIRDWRATSTPDGQHLEIELIAPVEHGGLKLSIFTERALDSAADRITWSVPLPLAVERENGRLTFSADDMTVATEALVALRQIEAPAKTLAAFQFHERPCTLTLRLNRIDPVVHTQDRISARVEESRLVADHTLNLKVEKAGIYSLELGALGNWTVNEVKAEALEAWQATNGTLRLSFARRLLGEATIVIQTELAVHGLDEPLTLTALRVQGAEREAARIGVGAAPGIRLRTRELAGLRETPVTELAEREDAVLAYSAEAPDWTLTLAAERMQPRVLAEVFNLVTIGDGLVGGSASVRFAILNQGVQDLKVRVPAHWKNVDFIGSNIRRKDQKDELWTISLQEKAWGGYTLVVTYDFAFDPQQATLALGGLHVADVERETGTLAVSSVPSLKLTEKTAAVNASARLERIDETELAPADRALISHAVLLAYRYSGNDYDLRVDVTRFKPVAVLQAAADLTQIDTVLTQEGQLLTQASFMIKNNEKQFQRFRLPAGADFWACYADNEPVKPGRDGDAILVPLPRGINRDDPHAIQIVYAEKAGDLRARLPRTLALHAPRSDIPTTFAQWRLYIPPTHVLTHFGGNMTPASGTRYGLREAWNQFINFYEQAYLELRGLAVAFAVLLGFVAFIVFAVRRKWTSLVGLLVTVFVIIILAGMLLPAMSKARNSAARSARHNAERQAEMVRLPQAEIISGLAPASAPAPVSDMPVPDEQSPRATTPETTLIQKLEQIIIPEIDFRQANIHDVIQFLQDSSIQWDRSSDGSKGVNIILNLGASEIGESAPFGVFGEAAESEAAEAPQTDTQSITFKAREISLLEALKIVTDVSSLKYRIEGNVVVILPYSAAIGKIEHKVYDVLPTMDFGESSPTDWKAFFAEMGVEWPIGSSIKYVPALGKLMVANTSDNLEVLEQRLSALNSPRAKSQARQGITDLSEVTAAKSTGVQSIRIDLPRTGNRYEFTKVLDLSGEAVTLSAWAMRGTTLSAVQGIVMLVVFLFGWLLLWRERRRDWPRAGVMAIGLMLILGSAAALLLVARLLGPALIAALPLLSLVIFVALVRSWRNRRRAATPPRPAVAAGGAAIGLCLMCWAGATATAAQQPPVHPLGHVEVISAVYDGAVAGEVARLNVTLECEAIQLDPQTKTAEAVWFGTEAALVSFKASSRNVRLIHAEGGTGIRFDRREKARVELSFATRVKDEAGQRRLSFKAPKSMGSRLVLILPEPQADVEIPAAVSFEAGAAPDPSGGKGQTRVTALLGESERLEVRWVPRLKRAAEAEAIAFVETRALARLRDGVMNLRATLLYQVTQGELRGLQLAIPEGQRVLRVEGAGITTWNARLAEGTNMLEIALAQPVSSQCEVTVETETTLKALPAAVTVAGPRASRVMRETGLIAVATGDEIGLQVERAESLQKVEPEEFRAPAGSTNAVGDRLQAVYRFLKSDYALQLKLENLQPEIEASVINHVRLGHEQITVAARADFEIKRAGVFALRLGLPDGYRVTKVQGSQVAQWTEAGDASNRVLNVRLKERTLGKCSLFVSLYQWLPKRPEAVAAAAVIPLDTSRLTGFIKIGSELGLQVKAKTFEGLTEVPASSVVDVNTGSGALAYKFHTEGKSGAIWALNLAVEAVEPWVRAESVQTFTLNAAELGLVEGSAQVRYDVQNAPVKTFLLKVPSGARNVEISGPNIRRRDQDGDQWQVEMQSRVSGEVTLIVTWDRMMTNAAGRMELRGVEAVGVERETGAVVVRAQPPLQVTEHGTSGDVVRADEHELPAWAAPSGTPATLVWRYLRPGWELITDVQRFRDAEVLNALVDSARYATVVAEDGQMMTEASLLVRNTARQYLELTLPAGAEIWSAFVNGDAVRPSMRGEKLLVPLAPGTEGSDVGRVELVYVGSARFPTRRGMVDLQTPAFDAPVKDAVWELYLPPDYEYTRFRGTMMYTPPEVKTRNLLSFSMLEYEEAEGQKKAARTQSINAKLEGAKQKLAGNELKDANVVYQQVRGRGDAIGADKEDLQQFESDLRKAQASNVLEGQRSFFAKNVEGGSGGDWGQLQQTGNYDYRANLEVAAQQYERLQQAQDLAVANVRPLHINLPKRGLQYAFVQPLQTEVGKPMTVQFRATNARGVSLPMGLMAGIGSFVFLWIVAAFTLGRKE